MAVAASPRPAICIDALSYYAKFLPFFSDAGWRNCAFDSRKQYVLCTRSTQNSALHTEDYSRLRIWRNKLYLYYHLRGKAYIPPTFAVLDGRWLHGAPPQERDLFYVKLPDVDGARGNVLCPSRTAVMEYSATTLADRVCVVQPSIPDLMLHHGKKFDLRIWAVLYSRNHIDFELHVHRVGRVRLSSRTFDTCSMDFKVHFTNTAVQNGAGGFTFFDESFPRYAELFASVLAVAADVFEESCKFFRNYSKRKHALVNLLGFDFIFDAAGACFLLEVNSRPHLTKDHAFLMKNVAEHFFVPCGQGSAPTAGGDAFVKITEP